jgi:hypothetical protein
MTWNDLNPDEAVLRVEHLGTIKISPTRDGLAVDINGIRAWERCKDELPTLKLKLIKRIRQWEFMNSFARG